MEKDYNF